MYIHDKSKNQVLLTFPHWTSKFASAPKNDQYKELDATVSTVTNMGFKEGVYLCFFAYEQKKQLGKIEFDSRK